MRKLFALFLCVVMLLSMSVPALAADAVNSENVVILYINDVHTYIDGPLSCNVIAGLRAELGKRYEHVLLVDAGDAVQGTACSGRPGSTPGRVLLSAQQTLRWATMLITTV